MPELISGNTMLVSEKQALLDEIRKSFVDTTDATGHMIDPGIFEIIVLLNALGWSTNASCEGDALPYAWIDFNTEEEIIQAKLDKDGQSAYWNTHKDARNLANQKTDEKFGAGLTSWTDEIRNYWFDEFLKSRDAHPQSKEYEVIQDKINDQKKALAGKIEELKNEFLKSINEPLDTMCVEEKLSRLDFATQEVVDTTEVGESPEVHERSSYLLKQFENFLKEKYATS
jgi:hypothetical protein